MIRKPLAVSLAVVLTFLTLGPPGPAAAASRYDRLLASADGRSKLVSLAAMEDAAAIDPAVFEPLLTDKEPLIRARCAEVLGRIGDRSFIPYLAALIGDKSDIVSTTAAYSLGLVGGAAAVEPLKKCLGDKKPSRVPYVLEALGKTGAKEAAPVLAPWLRNFNSSMRAQAALALAFTGDSTAALELDAIIQDPEAHVAASAAYAMGRLGYKAGVDAIAALLTRKESEVRFRAIEALGRLKAESAVPAIAPLTKDPDRWVAIKAAEAIGRIGSSKGASALEGLLTSKDDYLRTLALNGLAVVGVKRQFELVKPLLADPSQMVRRAALGAAVKTGKDDARPLLLRAIEKGSIPERSTALELLGTLGKSEDLLLLTRALGSTDDVIAREGAAAGLGNWPKTDELSKPCGYADAAGRKLSPLEALVEAANGADWVVASIAVESLGKAGPVEIVPDLMRVYDAHSSYNDGDRKLAVIQAIDAKAGKLGSKEIDRFSLGPFLARAATAPDPRVAHAAVLTGGKLGMKLEEKSSGVWQRGVYPWGAPALPLGERRVVITTPRGEIEILLYGDEAPNAVKSLLTLAEKKFFDGFNFHRVVPGFVIQGGCPRGDGWGDAGYLIRNEVNMHRYDRGTVGMADSGKDTAGSQFFVTQTAQPHLNGRYVIVGKVVRGMAAVDAVEEGDVFSVRVIQ